MARISLTRIKRAVPNLTKQEQLELYNLLWREIQADGTRIVQRPVVPDATRQVLKAYETKQLFTDVVESEE